MLGHRNITENTTEKFTGNALNSTLRIQLTWKTNNQLLCCMFKSHVLSRVALNVNYRPRILQTKVEKTVEELSSFNISCVVSANPEVPGMVSWERKYFHQWKYVGTSALQYKITDDVSAWNLMTSSIVMIQKYRCKAFNGIGKAVNSNEIIIYVKDIIIEDKKQTYLEHHETFVKCSTTKEMTNSVAIRWYLDDKHDLTDNSTQDLAQNFDGKTRLQSTLIFYPSRQDNLRNLTCKAGDGFNLMDTILLNITYCPEDVKLDCTVVNSRSSLNSLTARCESGLSNPAARLILKMGDTSLTSHLPPVRKSTQMEGVHGFTTAITYQHSKNDEIKDLACCAELPMCEPVCSMTKCNTKTLADNQYSKILSMGLLGATLLVAIVFCVCCFVYCSHKKTANLSSSITHVDTIPIRSIQNGPNQNQEVPYESVDERINERVSRGSCVEARCSALPPIPTDSSLVDRFEDMNADTFEESVCKKDSKRTQDSQAVVIISN
ncbi:hypothetical protein HOLleu_24111 [Holothuria leucospilota]|uniref:Ig-like domain-containing protein n=1 Tax=Holothuria leucospilota TaxID=206669 RepID=A0A9Q1BW52_HOLLE|nr:hypothetical protein HOLleu_24111 [Holothuria leucospilota]